MYNLTLLIHRKRKRGLKLVALGEITTDDIIRRSGFES